MSNAEQPMVFIIFTTEGLNEAKSDIISNKAQLWINDNVLTDADNTSLSSAGIEINILPEYVDANKEKAVIAALAFVESQAPNHEILIEYI